MNRFKPRFRIFIDEVGSKPKKGVWPPSDINERYFSLTGIIMECTYVRQVFEPDFKTMVVNHFGEDCGPLHRRELVHKQGRFAVLSDDSKRRAWGDDFLSFSRRHYFSSLTVCLDRVEYTRKYGRKFDPYEKCMEEILTEYFNFLKSCDCVGDVYAEARNIKADESVRKAYKQFYEHGPFEVANLEIRERLSSKKIHIKPKSKNIPGLQFVDLLASALKRSVLFRGERLKINDFSQFQRHLLRYLWSHKVMRHDKGPTGGTGIIWLPKND